MTPPAASVDTALPPAAVIARFDAGMPALRGYPASSRFVGAIGSDDVLRALRRRRPGAMVAHGGALALQINMPFCERAGVARGCAQVITRRHACVQRYLQGLRAEAGVAGAAMGPSQAVSRIHVGGAAPLFLSDDELGALLAFLRDAFQVTAEAEISVQAAVSLCTPARVARLREAGFNRLNLELEVEAHDGSTARLGPLLLAARSAAYASVVVDLACASVRHGAREIERVAALRPDRVRLTGHAAATCALPSPAGKVAEASLEFEPAACRLAALEALLSAGYLHLGLDEFALETDPLASAWRQGRLHPGPDGLSVKPEGDVLALGLSTEGRIGNIVYRNVDALSAYYAAPGGDRLPVARGLALGRDELARLGVISGLLCQGRVDFESIDLAHLIDMRRHFARELVLLEPMVQAGLVDVDHEAIELTATGRWFAPTVAALFDRELQRDVLRSRTAALD